MLFNSLDFAFFLPIVFFLYWFVTNHNLKLQNILIVVASYVFYGWWDWRFLILIIFSTTFDYFIGLLLKKEEVPIKRKLILWASISINLGFLGFFKYYNFFLDSFVSAFSFFGYPIGVSSLNIILPVGISFYTFQSLSYTIDVYKRNLEPTTDFISFTAFVCFFPQLVAGPIERAVELLPQFYNKRTFDYSKSVDGMRQMLWGLFKKIVIADNCAEYANMFFNHSSDYSGSTLVLGAIFFTIQIYCDFSAYSDIAIGTARLFGFELMQNFNYPFFSRDMAEFWRRWHISLSTWFRDYLYIPLGGSRGGTWSKVRNTGIVFIVSGLWHGANWTFIIWGALNALFVLPLVLIGKNKTNMEIVAKGKRLPMLKEVAQIVLTFALTVFSLIFFRAMDLSHAISYLSQIFSKSLFTVPDFEGMTKAATTLLFVALLFIVEWYGREEKYPISNLGLNWSRPLRFAMYSSLIFAILWFGGKEQSFIYFQF